VLDLGGRRIGSHAGAHRFTVGQRRGLGIGGGTPLYVLATDPDDGSVTVGPRAALATHTVMLRDPVLHRQGFDRVRLRHHHAPLQCTARRVDGGLELTLAAPAYGAAPGQLACLMDGELIVGHATIARTPVPAATRARRRPAATAGRVNPA